MKRETVAFLLAGTAWAAPTTAVVPRASWLDHYPQFCDDQLLRGKSENKVWTEEDIGGTLAIFASMKSNNYNDYINNGKEKENKSFSRYVAQILGLNFNWKCDVNDCALTDGADKCKKSESGGQIYLYLDSALAYWNYFDSFKKAIDNARDEIMGRLPSMWGQFGGPEDEGIHWTEAVGMMTAGASMAAGFLPSGGTAAELGLGLIDTIAAQFAPEENTEKKFDAYANASMTFTENVEILTDAINKYLKHEFEEPLDWDKKAEDQVHAIHNAVQNDPMSKAIMTGEFAGLDTPKIDLKDEVIKAGLAAPLINAMWRHAKNYVVKFDRAAWDAAGIDICKEDAFPDMRAEGDKRIGCGESDGSLYMIAHWGDTPNFDHTKYFRDVKGIDALADFGISRGDVIGGSIANFDNGGFDHLPSQSEIFDRVKGAGNKDTFFRGPSPVWNLPFCIAVPTTLWPEDNLEEALSHHARFSCTDMKDKNGKEWPYKVKK